MTDKTILKLEYPSDINKCENNEDVYKNRRVIFMALTGEPSYLNQKEFYTSTKSENLPGIDQEVKCMISLPIPSSLRDAQTHTWSDDSIQSAVGDIVSSGVDAYTDIAGGGSGAGDKLTKLLRVASGVGNVVSKSKDLYAYGTGSRKPMLKPGVFQNFKSSELRTFSFSFTFITESKDEAEQIRKIIGAFKIFSLPSSLNYNPELKDEEGYIDTFVNFAKQVGSDAVNSIGSAFTMMSPFVWQVIVTNENVNDMLQLKTCVCTNVDVTYGTGKFDCFEDGMPKMIVLSLNFKETQLQYAENYSSSLDILKNDFNQNPTDVRDTPKKISDDVKSFGENVTNSDLRAKTKEQAVKDRSFGGFVSYSALSVVDGVEAIGNSIGSAVSKGVEYLRFK